MKLPRVDVILSQPELAGHPASYEIKKRAVQQALAARRAVLRGKSVGGVGTVSGGEESDRADRSGVSVSGGEEGRVADRSDESMLGGEEGGRSGGSGEVVSGGEERSGSAADVSRDRSDAAAIAVAVAASLTGYLEARPRRLLNCTGVLLHTNLGRAPLSEEAVAAMVAAAGSCELEFLVEDGRRGSRMTWLRPLLRLLLASGTDDEDVHVVNNGAAALLLACSALGQPGGVVLSRGQMVEIGDGFRVAEMAAAGGVRVHEVGSTNRSYVRDYAAALDAGASAILWVHLSNFSQAGFVAQPSLAELRALADERGVPLIADIGSGSLGVMSREPSVQAYLREGAGLVTFSGDKLLGGPQAGLLVGAGEWVERCRRHPLTRALRPDKTAIAALHATAAAHARDDGSLPLQRMISASVAELRGRAGAIVAALGWPDACVRASEATVGGGSLPGDVMASVAIVVPVARPERVAQRLRVGAPGVVGRVHAGELWLDLRALLPNEDEGLVAALRSL